MSDRDICRSKKENNFYIEALAIPVKQKKESNRLGLRRSMFKKMGCQEMSYLGKALKLCRWKLVSSFDIGQAENLSYFTLKEGFGRNKMDRNLTIIGFRAEN